MAMSVNDGGYGSRSRRRGSGGALSEINVTPFVDVVLVLLIIFMLTAHVMEYGIAVDLPQTKYVKDTTQDLPVITIDKNGEYTLGNGDKVNINLLVQTIRARYPNAKGVYVRADKETIWDGIAQVTAELAEGKFIVYMVTQPMDAAPRKR